MTTSKDLVGIPCGLASTMHGRDLTATRAVLFSEEGQTRNGLSFGDTGMKYIISMIVWILGLLISSHFNNGEAHPWVMLWGGTVMLVCREITRARK